ncbi:MAG: hypothetical protein KDA33_00865, partial [Phycisphaerales bacterium]|nr:hypothetical protein [Phycisphaerales bacterium]
DEHLAAIRQGWVTPPFCRARLTPPTTWMVRRWSIVLLAQSRFMFSERDDAGGRSLVLGEIVALANLLETSRRESEIRISAAMRCNLAQEIARAIGETPACTHIPPMDGLLATGADLAASPSSLLAGAILDERSEFDRIFVRDGDWLDVSEASALYLDPYFARSRVWNLISPIYYSRDEANAALDTLVSRLNRCETAAQIREEFSRQPDDLRAAAPLMCRTSGYHYYQADLVQTLESAYLGRAANEAAACLIALHNYRADFGEYPVDLKTLVPDFLARPPIDFAVRRPLRYERRGEGFVLYSIGADGVDNHGRTADEREFSESPWGPDGVDVVFSNIVREPVLE